MNYNISQKKVLSTFFLSVQVVSDYIETKTAVDDRRHGTLVNNEVAVNLALAASQADLYRLNSLFFRVRLTHNHDFYSTPSYLLTLRKRAKFYFC